MNSTERIVDLDSDGHARLRLRGRRQDVPHGRLRARRLGSAEEDRDARGRCATGKTLKSLMKIDYTAARPFPERQAPRDGRQGRQGGHLRCGSRRQVCLTFALPEPPALPPMALGESEALEGTSAPMSGGAPSQPPSLVISSSPRTGAGWSCRGRSGRPSCINAETGEAIAGAGGFEMMRTNPAAARLHRRRPTPGHDRNALRRSRRSSTQGFRKGARGTGLCCAPGGTS